MNRLLCLLIILNLVGLVALAWRSTRRMDNLSVQMDRLHDELSEPNAALRDVILANLFDLQDRVDELSCPSRIERPNLAACGILVGTLRRKAEASRGTTRAFGPPRHSRGELSHQPFVTLRKAKKRQRGGEPLNLSLSPR